MDRMRISRRGFGLGLGAALAGCAGPERPPVQSFHTAPGAVIVQLVESERLAQGFSIGAGAEGQQTTAVVTYRFKSLIGTTVVVEEHRLDLRPRGAGGMVYVSEPRGFAFRYETQGNASGPGVGVYNTGLLTGRTQEIPERAMGETTKTIAVSLDPKAPRDVQWGPVRLRIIEASSAGLRYHLNPPQARFPDLG